MDEELISKKALLEELNGLQQILVSQGDPFLASIMTQAIRCAEGQTAVDAVEVVQGRWEIAIGYDPKRAFCCENCQRMAYEPSNYCPACGAKMYLEVQDGEA